MAKRILSLLIIIFFLSAQETFSQTNAGPDQELCMDSTFMQADDPYPNTGYWTVLVGTATIETPTLFNTKVKDIPKGSTIVFIWTLEIGDDTIEDEMIIRNNDFDLSAGPDIPICTDENMPLTEPEDGLWTYLEGCGSLIENTVTGILELFPCRGDNILKLTVTRNGCTNTDTLNIINNTIDVNAGEDQYLDPFETSTFMDANLPTYGSGQWSILQGGGILEDFTSPTTFISGLPEGINIFRWTVQVEGYGSCYGTDEIKIIVGMDNCEEIKCDLNQTICSDTAVMNEISEAGAVYNYWDIVEGGGVFDDIFDPKTIVREIPGGVNIYRWNVEYPGYICYHMVEVTNHLYQANILEPEYNSTVCYDHTEVTADENYEGDGYWTMVSGAGNISNTTLFHILVENLSIGENIIKWTVNTDDCISFDERVITYIKVEAHAGPDTSIYTSDYQMIAEDPPVGTGYWSLLAGSSVIEDPSLFNTVIYNYSEGPTVFLWTVSNDGCSDSDELTITYIQTDINPIDEYNYKIYPNPTDGIILIRSTEDLSDALIKLIDLSGKELDCNIRKKGNKEVQLDISHLAKGIYFIKINTRGQTKLLKVLKN